MICKNILLTASVSRVYKPPDVSLSPTLNSSHHHQAAQASGSTEQPATLNCNSHLQPQSPLQASNSNLNSPRLKLSDNTKRPSKPKSQWLPSGPSQLPPPAFPMDALATTRTATTTRTRSATWAVPATTRTAATTRRRSATWAAPGTTRATTKTRTTRRSPLFSSGPFLILKRLPAFSRSLSSVTPGISSFRLLVSSYSPSSGGKRLLLHDFPSEPETTESARTR